MIVREHVFVFGGCLYCPARRDDPNPAICKEREDYQPTPPPDRGPRQMACEDGSIRAAMLAIREAAKPRCAATKKTVHDCLRTSAKCPEACPHHEFWTGPQTTPEEAGAFC